MAQYIVDSTIWIPNYQIDGINFKSQYCKDHSNQGGENQGMAVFQISKKLLPR